MNARRYDAVLSTCGPQFLDSWRCGRIAGDTRAARRWRERLPGGCLQHGTVRALRVVVARARRGGRIWDRRSTQRLNAGRYGQLRRGRGPRFWPRSPAAIDDRHGDELFRRARATRRRLGRNVPFEGDGAAQSAGAYKPQPSRYRRPWTRSRCRRNGSCVSGRVAISIPAREVAWIVWWHKPGRHARPPQASPDRRASLARPAPGF